MNIKDTENIIKASERKNRSPRKEKKIGIRFLSNHNDTKRQQNNILYTKRRTFHQNFISRQTSIQLQEHNKNILKHKRRQMVAIQRPIPKTGLEKVRRKDVQKL